jgi:hypothetical protein
MSERRKSSRRHESGILNKRKKTTRKSSIKRIKKRSSRRNRIVEKEMEFLRVPLLSNHEFPKVLVNVIQKPNLVRTCKLNDEKSDVKMVKKTGGNKTFNIYNEKTGENTIIDLKKNKSIQIGNDIITINAIKEDSFGNITIKFSNKVTKNSNYSGVIGKTLGRIVSWVSTTLVSLLISLFYALYSLFGKGEKLVQCLQEDDNVVPNKDFENLLKEAEKKAFIKGNLLGKKEQELLLNQVQKENLYLKGQQDSEQGLLPTITNRSYQLGFLAGKQEMQTFIDIVQHESEKKIKNAFQLGLDYNKSEFTKLLDESYKEKESFQLEKLLLIKMFQLGSSAKSKDFKDIQESFYEIMNENKLLNRDRLQLGNTIKTLTLQTQKSNDLLEKCVQVRDSSIELNKELYNNMTILEQDFFNATMILSVKDNLLIESREQFIESQKTLGNSLETIRDMKNTIDATNTDLVKSNMNKNEAKNLNIILQNRVKHFENALQQLKIKTTNGLTLEPIQNQNLIDEFREPIITIVKDKLTGQLIFSGMNKFLTKNRTLSELIEWNMPFIEQEFSNNFKELTIKPKPNTVTNIFRDVVMYIPFISKWMNSPTEFKLSPLANKFTDSKNNDIMYFKLMEIVAPITITTKIITTRIKTTTKTTTSIIPASTSYIKPTSVVSPTTIKEIHDVLPTSTFFNEITSGKVTQQTKLVTLPQVTLPVETVTLPQITLPETTVLSTKTVYEKGKIETTTTTITSFIEVKSIIDDKLIAKSTFEETPTTHASIIEETNINDDSVQIAKTIVEKEPIDMISENKSLVDNFINHCEILRAIHNGIDLPIDQNTLTQFESKYLDTRSREHLTIQEFETGYDENSIEKDFIIPMYEGLLREDIVIKLYYIFNFSKDEDIKKILTPQEVLLLANYHNSPLVPKDWYNFGGTSYVFQYTRDKESYYHILEKIPVTPTTQLGTPESLQWKVPIDEKGNPIGTENQNYPNSIPNVANNHDRIEYKRVKEIGN